MKLIDRSEQGNRPGEIDFARYIFKILRDYGYGDEATVTLRWTLGPYILSVTLENKAGKFLS
jgi:hypothetical protein